MGTDLPAGAAYTGCDNLEAMEAAVNYRRYLVGLVSRCAGVVRPGLRMLDFGAGTGTHAMALRDLGYQVVCVEANDRLRGGLRSSGLDAVASFADLEGRFDLVYTLNVLEHIEDDRGVLRSMADVLVPGGTLVVYVPAFEALFTPMDHKVGHLRRYRRSQLVERVAGAGLQVHSCGYADPLGLFATLAYKMVGSRNGDLNPRAVAAYDRLVFPVSRVLEGLARPWFGKNLALVAKGPLEDEGP
jgi:SAM-dependent methyltransferase